MPLITLTSSFGLHGEMIAEKISNELNIPFFDDRKQHEKALSMGVSHEELKSLDQNSPGFFDRLFSSKPSIYLDLLGSVVYDIASYGDGIIVGHGAQFFLSDFDCALHVLISSSERSRSEKIANEQNIELDKAINLVHKMDKSQKDFIYHAFNRDLFNLSSYDLAINLDKMSEEWAVKTIVELSNSNEVKECSINAIEKMEKTSLKRKIYVSLIKNNFSLTLTHVFVDVTDEGIVHLTGSTFSSSDRQELIDIVSGVPGVQEVKSDIIVPKASYNYY